MAPILRIFFRAVQRKLIGRIWFIVLVPIGGCCSATWCCSVTFIQASAEKSPPRLWMICLCGSEMKDPLLALIGSAAARCFRESNIWWISGSGDFAMRGSSNASIWIQRTSRIGQRRSQERRKRGTSLRDSLHRYNGWELTIQRFNPSTLQRGEAVGVELSWAGLGETAGDGVAEAAASLLLASSISFFSST